VVRFTLPHIIPWGRTPITPCMNWVDPRAGLDAVEKGKSVLLPEIEPWFLGCATHSLITTLNELPRLIQMYTGCIFCCHCLLRTPLTKLRQYTFQRAVTTSEVHTATITMVEIRKFCQLIQGLQYEQEGSYNTRTFVSS
jgi:hypothetical protein